MLVIAAVGSGNTENTPRMVGTSRRGHARVSEQRSLPERYVLLCLRVGRHIDGFIDALGLGRCEEVRLADSHGQYEEHLPSGKGRIDFRHVFRRIEREAHFTGHYMCAFGSLEVMLAGREYLAREAQAALG